eukprot:5446002-Pleurochrysis_carterae.AAC.1
MTRLVAGHPTMSDRRRSSARHSRACSWASSVYYDNNKAFSSSSRHSLSRQAPASTPLLVYSFQC